MSSAHLQRLSVSTSAEAEAAVMELLARVFGATPAAYSDTQRRTTRVSVYLPKGKLAAKAQLTAVRAGLREIAALGLTIGPGRITVAKVRREDWAESWKRHFRPLEVGGKLLVRPSWSRRRARRGEVEVVLDPGLSFGTGQHATTSFCLRELVRLRNPKAPQSLLDAGTGSGILAIAAAKLGYAPVEAFDFDPDAVRVARENAEVNGVSLQLKLSQADLTRLPLRVKQPFDVVCANLISDLLMAESRRLLARVRPGGALILAGILREQFDSVRAHFEKCGLHLVRTRGEREWRSGSFLVPQ
jgi:ribosomal protein L11 methyltransferase